MMSSVCALFVVALLQVLVLVSPLRGVAGLAEGQLEVWKVSGCTPGAPYFPNDTLRCPFSTPTTLTIEGAGFKQYGPNNFSVCLGGRFRVTVPFDGAVLDDNTLTVTTSEEFYTQTGFSQWGSRILI